MSIENMKENRQMLGHAFSVKSTVELQSTVLDMMSSLRLIPLCTQEDMPQLPTDTLQVIVPRSWCQPFAQSLERRDSCAGRNASYIQCTVPLSHSYLLRVCWPCHAMVTSDCLTETWYSTYCIRYSTRKASAHLKSVTAPG